MARNEAHLVPTGNVQVPSLPSPTVVEGEVQGYHHPDPAVIAAAREPVAHQEGLAPRGFVNDKGHLCYKNALLVLILCSDRFMSYIQNRHIPHAAAMVSPTVPQRTSPRRPGSFGQQEPTAPTRYTDILSQINDLWQVYWARSEQNDATVAMEGFWQYVRKANKSGLGVRPWNFEGHQDPADLLENLMTIAREQMQQKDALVAWAEVLTLNSMVQCVKYVYRRCAQCRDKKNVKIRSPNDLADTWMVHIDEFDLDPKTGRRTRKTMLDLRNILHRGVLKEISDPFCCGDCDKAWREKIDNQSKAARENDMEATMRREYAARLRNLQKNSDYIWQRYVRLPEILFMQILIFDKTQRKISIKLTIPEEIDVTEYVDQAEFEGSTQYRLVGVICHQGFGIEDGHYVSYVKHKERWWFINDEYQESVAFAEINHPRQDRSPYVLLWEKVPEAKTANEKSIRQVASTEGATAPAPQAGTRAGSKTLPPPKTRPGTPSHQIATVAPQRPEEVPKTSGQISGTYIIDGRRISYCLDIPYIPDIIPRTYAPDAGTTTSSKLKKVSFEHEGHVRLYPGPDRDGHKRTKTPIAKALDVGSVIAVDDVKTDRWKQKAWFNWYNNIVGAKGGVRHPETMETKEVWEKRIAHEAAQAAKDAEPRRKAAEAAMKRNAQSNPPEPKSPVTAIQPVPSGKKKTKTKDAGTDPKTPPVLDVSKVKGVAISPRSPKPSRKSPGQPSSASSSRSSSSSDLSSPPDSPSSRPPPSAPKEAERPTSTRAARPAAQATRTYLPRGAKSAVLDNPPWLTGGNKRKRADDGDDEDSKPKTKAQKTTAGGKGKAPVKKASKTGKATKATTTSEAEPKTKSEKPRKAPAKKGRGRPPKK